MFTYEFWLAEVQVFREIFARDDRPEQVYVLALSGLTHLAASVTQTDPAHKDDVMQDFREGFALAKKVKGTEWVLDHIEVISTHGPMPT